jgi:hypothetical protein
LPARAINIYNYKSINANERKEEMKRNNKKSFNARR